MQWFVVVATRAGSQAELELTLARACELGCEEAMMERGNAMTKARPWMGCPRFPFDVVPWAVLLYCTRCY
jgi:hypothetical protein